MSNPAWLALGGSAWATRKVLGRSLDVVGETLERWTTLRLKNVARIMENAGQKAGNTLEQEGTVPARVAMRIFEEGSYSDDQLIVEYLGGVLASSRTEMGRDDRGNGWTRLVAELSSYELRHHYISYRVLRDLLVGRDDLDLRNWEVLQEIQVFVPEDEWIAAMDFGPSESVDSIHLHNVYGLRQADVLRVLAYSSGNWSRIDKWPEVNEPGEIFSPSGRGIQLFLWAHGAGGADVMSLLDPDLKLAFTGSEIEIPRTARLVVQRKDPGTVAR